MFLASPQWMTKSVKDKIKLKRMAWTKYKKSLCSVDYSTYAQCRNECTAAVRKAKYDYENRLVQGIKVNPKRFWKYVASQTKVKQVVGGLLKTDGSQTVDDIDTANTLNKFLVVCSHMKILQTHLHLKTGTWEIPLVLLQLQLKMSGINYVDLSHVNLVGLITVIHEFFWS